MRIALIGGTGDIGTALALRLGRDTDAAVTIGSRDEAKAADSAAACRDELLGRGIDRSIESGANASAAADADVVVLAVPPRYVAGTIESIEPALDEETILVSPAVGMDGDGDGLHYDPPAAGSVAQLAAETAPEEVPVVGAFTNLPADRLADLDEDLEQDAPIVGDSPAAKRTVIELVSQIRGIRAVDAGPLSNAPELEALTPLLINVARYTDELAHPGIKFT